jgi:hypothetical protein
VEDEAMARSAALFPLCVLALLGCLVTGCGSTTSTPSPTVSPHGGGGTPSTPTPTSGGGGGSTLPPTTINPCTLLSDEQASTLTGATYGDGKEDAAGPDGHLCVWSDDASHSSVTVGVISAPSQAIAQQAFALAKGDQSGFAFTSVTNLADQAYIARKSESTTDLSGLYAIDGSTYFFVATLGGTSPTDGALRVAALLVLGGLP